MSEYFKYKVKSDHLVLTAKIIFFLNVGSNLIRHFSGGRHGGEE